MTGWLSGWGTAQAFWSLRTAPAGWLGYLMVFTSLLWPAGDLAVSGLVTTVKIPGRCLFSMEGPISVFTVDEPTVYCGIYDTGPLYDLISQARTTSIRNGGLDGIYAKVNDDTNFRADPKDIIGNLSSWGYLLNQTEFPCYEKNTDGHGFVGTTNVVLLSASQSNYQQAPWDVRAATDMTISETQTKSFKLYECTMDAPRIEWLLAQVEPYTIFQGWCEKMQGYIFSNLNGAPLPKNPGNVIASSLNNMMTNAGSSWNDTYEPIVIEDPTQGCLAPHTLLAWPVLLLFAMVSITFLRILGYLVFLALQLRFLVHASLSPSASSTSKFSKGKSEQLPPSGYLTWMRCAVQETPQGRDATLGSLKKWYFGRGPSGDFVIVESKMGENLENEANGK